MGILFLHGYTGGRYELEPLFQYLKLRYNFEYEFPVYPGHGNVLDLEHTTGESWYQTAYEAYDRLRERANRIYIIGYSMGGIFASYIAQYFPVDRLVLIAPAFDYAKLTQLSKLHLAPRHFSEHMKLRSYHKIKKRIKNIPLRAFIEFKMIVDDKSPGLDNIMSETLIVHGKIDLLVPYASSIEASNKIEDSELVLIEDAPHLFCFTEDKQLELNIVTERFLFTCHD